MKVSRYAWSVVALSVVVILWGAVVRATGAGAGCGSHWPLCNGQMILVSPTVKTWIEFSHRLSSGLSLIAVMGLAILTHRALPPGHFARRASRWAVLFILLEAAIGASLVLLELVAYDQSSRRAISISLHLVNTLFLMASLTLTAWSAGLPASPRWPGATRAWRVHGTILGIGFLVLGATGALTALGDTLFPAQSIHEGMAQDWATSAHFLIRLRIFHPLLAALLVMMLYWGLPATPTPRWRNRTLGLAFMNFMVGLLNIGLLAPTPIQILHLAFANAIWIAGWLSFANAGEAPLKIQEPASDVFVGRVLNGE